MKADAEKVMRLLRTARGQIEGIIKMVEENRYCMDISGQILSCSAVLKKANGEIIAAHMYSCVKNAMESDSNTDTDKHIGELIELFNKLNG